MDKFSQLFLYIPGIIIFLVGSGQVRGLLRRRRPGQSALGQVISCDHVIKKDKKDREVYNFYNVTVEYTDYATKHLTRQSIKAATEYAVGQQVRIYTGQYGEAPTISEKESEVLFHPFVMMIGGALLILLALFQNQGKEVHAMLCLAAVFFGAGLSLFLKYLSLKRKGLESIPAEIVDIYERQISRATKILRGDKFTYYPVVRYTVDGKDNLRRCNINSSMKNSFKVGDTMNLYRDPATGAVTEQKARLGFAVTGVILVILGILVALSTLSVIG